MPRWCAARRLAPRLPDPIRWELVRLLSGEISDRLLGSTIRVMLRRRYEPEDVEAELRVDRTIKLDGGYTAFGELVIGDETFDVRAELMLLGGKTPHGYVEER